MVTEVRASHILVKTEQEANDILNKLNAGQNFEQLAQKHSTCPSGKKGGDLGFFTRGRMVKAFEDAAFSTEKGKLTKPVKTQFGYHIIKITDAR